MTWDPEQYLRFRAERRRPLYDLIDRVVRAADTRAIETAVDLGCGTGEATRALHRRVGATATLGIDGSPEMLAEAAAHAGDGVRFRRGDIAAFAGLAPEACEDEPRRFDLVFSNAALHWLPDHPRLVAGLLARVAPGGLLAFQVPANADHASHLTAAEVAAEPPFADALAGRAPQVDTVPGVLDVRAYAERLHALGVRDPDDLDVRLQIYGHELPSREAVVEWVKGSLLTAYQRALPDELWSPFLARYRERLFDRLPDTAPLYYTYKRILVCARAPQEPA